MIPFEVITNLPEYKAAKPEQQQLARTEYAKDFWSEVYQDPDYSSADEQERTELQESFDRQFGPGIREEVEKGFISQRDEDPGYDVIGGIKDFGKMIYDIPIQTLGAVGRLLEDPATRDEAVDKLVLAAKERTKKRAGEMAPGDREKKVIPLPDFLSESGAITRGDIQDTAGNVGFSAVSMGAGVAGGAAGKAVGRVLTIPLGPWGQAIGQVGGKISGQLVGSGVAAFRMDKSMVSEQLINAAEKAKGSVLTNQEVQELLARSEKSINNHALWEAGPEALGNALEMAGIGLIFKGAAKGMTRKIIGGFLGNVAAELVTETATQIGQAGEEIDMGLRQGEVPNVPEALKEVGPSVLLMSGGMSGAGYVAGKAKGVLTGQPETQPAPQPTPIEPTVPDTAAILAGESIDESIAAFRQTLGGDQAEAAEAVFTPAETPSTAEEAAAVFETMPPSEVENVLLRREEAQAVASEAEQQRAVRQAGLEETFATEPPKSAEQSAEVFRTSPETDLEKQARGEEVLAATFDRGDVEARGGEPAKTRIEQATETFAAAPKSDLDQRFDRIEAAAQATGTTYATAPTDVLERKEAVAVKIEDQGPDFTAAKGKPFASEKALRMSAKQKGVELGGYKVVPYQGGFIAVPKPQGLSEAKTDLYWSRQQKKYFPDEWTDADEKSLQESETIASREVAPAVQTVTAKEEDVSAQVGREEAGRYFKTTPNSSTIEVTKLLARGERVDPGKLASAQSLMDNAAAGLGQKRGPLRVIKRDDGTIKVLDGNTTLHELITRGEKYAEVQFVQKPLQSKSASKSMEALYDSARAAVGSIKRRVSELAEETGGAVKLRPFEDGLKKRETAELKLKNKYGGNISMIDDVVATTIVYKDYDHMKRAFDKIKKQENVLSWKNRYDQDGLSGYRDIQFTLIADNGHIYEMQLNTEPMMQAKKQLHALYKVIGLLTNEDTEGEIRALALGKLNDLMNYGYDAALSLAQGDSGQSVDDFRSELSGLTEDSARILSLVSGSVISNRLSPSTRKTLLDFVSRTNLSPPSSKNTSVDTISGSFVIDSTPVNIVTEQDNNVNRNRRQEAVEVVGRKTTEKNTPSPVYPGFEKNKIFTEKAVAAARENLKKNRNRLGAGIDPELMANVVTIGGAHFERGVRDFVEWSKEIVKEFGEKVRSYLEEGFGIVSNHPSFSGEKDDSSFINYEPPTTKAGSYKGAPDWVTGPEQLMKMRTRVAKLVKEGDVGRFWYEDSGRAILKMMGGDVAKTEKFIQLIAIYSPLAKVGANTTMAVKAWNQFVNGVPRGKFKVKTADQDSKAMGVLFDNVAFEGRKTNSFYINLVSQIIRDDPTAITRMSLDSETMAVLHKTVTVDMWMMRAFGYDRELVHNDNGTGSYSFVENETRRLAAQMNAKLKTGQKKWAPFQVQAAIWTAMKARFEDPVVKEKTWAESIESGYATVDENGQRWTPKNAADIAKHRAIWLKHALALTSKKAIQNAEDGSADFSTFIGRATSTVTWEAIPSVNIAPDLVAASSGIKKMFTDEARGILVDDNGTDLLAEKLGIGIAFVSDGDGAYGGNVSPNSLSHLVPSKTGGTFSPVTARSYARAIQYIFKQDAVPWYRPEPILNKEMREGQLFRVVSGKGAVIPGSQSVKLADARAIAEKRGEGFSVRGGKLARGVVLSFGRRITPQMEIDTLAALQSYLGQDAGFTRISDSEISIINFRDDNTGIPSTFRDGDTDDAPFIDDEDFLGRTQRFIDDNAEKLGLSDGKKIWVNGEYGYVHKWQSDKQGKEILAQGGISERPDLQGWLRDKQSEVEALVERYTGDELKLREKELGQLEGLAGVKFQISQSKDGTTKLVHWDQKPGLSTLDPAMAGSGLPGAERKRQASDPGNWVNRIYYGIEGGGYRKEAGLGPYRYNVDMPDKNLYDFAKDPDGIMAGVKSAAAKDPFVNATNLYEKTIKERGYSGYWTQTGMGKVAAVFEPQAPTSVTAQADQGVTLQQGDSATSQSIEDAMADLPTRERARETNARNRHGVDREIELLKGDSNVFWHGSPSGSLVGAKNGIHVGSFRAAEEALNARIGVPASGYWDGTREYGKTLLAGRKTQMALGGDRTGYNVRLPEEDFYPGDREEKAKYSDSSTVQLSSLPTISPVRIIGEMSNSRWSPKTDSKANSIMQAMLTKKMAKRGYYYKNDAEDYGSISAVVPGRTFLHEIVVGDRQRTLFQTVVSRGVSVSVSDALADLPAQERGVAEKLISSGRVQIMSNREALALAERHGVKITSEMKKQKIVGIETADIVALVPENIKKGELWAALRHAIGVHTGQLLLKSREFELIKKTIMRRRDEKSSTGDAIREAIAAVPENTASENYSEEVLAYMVTKSDSIGLVRRAIAIIKAMISRLGVSYKIFNEKDFMALADMAIKRSAKNADRSEWITSDSIKFQMAGPLSTTADTSSLHRAFEMQDAGEDRKKIWKETGWWEFVDGEWQYEIDDSLTEIILPEGFKKGGRFFANRIDQHFSNKPLFNAYPILRTVSIEFKPMAETELGDFDGKTRTIRVNSNKTPYEMRETIHHELQHAIQNIEGFAGGGNVNEFLLKRKTRAAMIDREIKEVNAILKEMANSKPQHMNLEEWDKAYGNLLGKRDALRLQYQEEVGVTEFGIQAKAFRDYRVLAGEVGARLIENRMDMTPERRKSVPPWYSLEVMLSVEGLTVPGEDPQSIMNVRRASDKQKSSAMSAPFTGQNPTGLSFVQRVSNSLDVSGKWDEFATWLYDQDHAIKVVQGKLGPQSPMRDYATLRALVGKKVAEKVREFDKETLQPLLAHMAENKQTMEDVESLAHAQTAPERNLQMKRVNARGYIDKMLGWMSAKEKEVYQQRLGDIQDEFVMLGQTLNQKRDNNITLMEDITGDLRSQRRQVDQLQAAFNQRIFTPAEVAKGTPDFLQKRLDNMYERLGKREHIAAEWDDRKDRLSGMTNADANDTLRRLGNPAMLETTERLRKISAAALDLEYAAGELTPEEYVAIKSAYKFYVPLMREGLTDSKRVTGKRGVGPLGSPVQTASGSTRAVVNIFANVIDQYQAAISRSEKLEAGRALFELVQANPDDNIWSFTELDRAPYHDVEGNIRFYPDQNIDLNTQTYIKVDGVKHLLEVNKDNPVAMRFMQAMNRQVTPMGPLVRLSAAINRVRARLNTTLTPEFTLPNFIRDLQTAFVNMSSTEADGMQKKVFGNIKNAIKGIYLSERGKPSGTWGAIYRDAARNGVIMGWAQSYEDVEELSKKIERDLEIHEGKRPVQEKIMALGNYIETVNKSFENGVRVATYQALVDSGVAKSKAASVAASLTTDFTQHGTVGPLMNALFMFSNAGIQGNVRWLSGAISSPKVRRMIVGIATFGVFSNIVGALMGGDDDDGESYYDKLKRKSPAMFERNIVIMIPGSEGNYIKIPVAYGFNIPFEFGNEIGSMMRGQNPTEAMMRFVNTAVNNLNPLAAGTIVQTITPDLADPIVQVYENKGWHGGPLMPPLNPWLGQPDSERYFKSVNPTLKAATTWINEFTGGSKFREGAISVSPETIEMIFETFSGGAGKLLNDTINLPVKAYRGEASLKDVPVARRFYGETPDNIDSGIYYDNREEMDVFVKELKNATQGERQALIRDPLYKLVGPFQSAESSIGVLIKQKKSIEAKGGDIQGITERIGKIQGRFNKRYNEAVGGR